MFYVFLNEKGNINMFCAKCGHEHPDDACFCTQCGASFTSKEFLKDNCSASIRKKRIVIKVLGVTSMLIQGVLFLLTVINVGLFLYTSSNNSFVEAVFDTFGVLILVMLLIIASSFLFTILGIKKKGNGFFVAATFFSFVSAAYGCAIIGSLALRQLIVFGTLAIYIVIIILNYQCNKEYKKHFK